MRLDKASGNLKGSKIGEGYEVEESADATDCVEAAGISESSEYA